MARLSATPFTTAGFINGSYSLPVDAGTGANRVLVVYLVHESSLTNAIVSGTYNGVAMSQTAETVGGTGSNYRRRLLWLVNPAAGSNTLAITATGDHKYRLLAVVHNGVSAVSGATITSVLTTTTHTVAVTSATGALVLGFADWAPSFAGTQVAGTTEVYDADLPVVSPGARLWYGEAAGAASVTVGATTAGSQLSVIAGLSLTPAAGDVTPPVITGPGGATGATATATITAPATAVHTYTANESVTWSLNGGANVGLFAINSSTGALTFSSASVAGSYVVGVRATDAASNATTQTLTVTVSAAGVAPSITVQPANTTVTAGQTASFSVTATGSALTYQWQRNPNGNTSFSNIGGATLASYTTPATTVTGGSANSADTYRCVVTGDTAPAATSSAAVLTVNAAAPAPAPPPGGAVLLGVSLLDGGLLIL